MIQLSFVYKVSADLTKIIDEVRLVSSNYNAGLFHIYSGVSIRDNLIAIMGELKEAFPSYIIVGTESGGEIQKGRLCEDTSIVISCMLFENTEIRLKVYDNLSGNEKSTGKQMRKDINRHLAYDLKAVEILLPGALLNTFDMYEELKLCDPDVVIFGGYAGNHDADLDNAFVMADGVCYPDALIAVLYCGEDFHINVAKSAGWHSLGMPLKITKASGNVLSEIGGIPAVEAYRRYLNIKADSNFIDNTNEFPIAAYVNGEELLRHTSQLLDDGSLLLAGSVMEGWNIYFTFGNPAGIIDTVNKRLEVVYGFRPQAICLYSCYVRKLFWERFVNVEIEPFQELANTSGFYTFGEVLRNKETGDIMEYNITLLSIAMREGDNMEFNVEKAPEIDEALLSGQASLVKRLAELVSSSTKEIQEAYQNLEKINDRLRYTSEHDALTDLYNRGKIESLIDDFLATTALNKKDSSIVMFDLDYFKKVNDTYGHKIGDIVLQEIAEVVKGMISSSNKEYAGRWGGEEFFILLPGFDKNQGFDFAESFRRRVEQKTFGGVLSLTVSVGVTTVNGTEKINEIYSKIDSALYRAKGEGRNKVISI